MNPAEFRIRQAPATAEELSQLLAECGELPSAYIDFLS
ncbi:MAG: hypothetical protein QG602_2809, partial [Verrucomicrobiota bacterium]|nr:hypothetical protein [Verrucomicrobiota bacterium]